MVDPEAHFNEDFEAASSEARAGQPLVAFELGTGKQGTQYVGSEEYGKMAAEALSGKLAGACKADSALAEMYLPD
jgi:hypothetical protein